MFSAGWATIFNVLQLIDPVYDTEGMPEGQGIPVWPIDAGDATKLGNATVMYLESQKGNAKLKEFLEKHLPLLVLGGAIAEVGGPRVQFSFEQKQKARKERAKALAAQNAGGRTNLRSVQSTQQQSSGTSGSAQNVDGRDASGAGEVSTWTDAFTSAS